jgi:hypothetical protein
LQPIVRKSKILIGQSEKFLTRVLKTNEELTGLANNLPLEEGAENRHKKGVDWLEKLLGIYNDKEGWHYTILYYKYPILKLLNVLDLNFWLTFSIIN